DRAAQAPAVGIAGIGIAADVAALHVVVGQAAARVLGGGGERKGGDQGQGSKPDECGGALHGNLVVVIGGHATIGVPAILSRRSQPGLNTEPGGTGTIRDRSRSPRGGTGIGFSRRPRSRAAARPRTPAPPPRWTG